MRGELRFSWVKVSNLIYICMHACIVIEKDLSIFSDRSIDSIRFHSEVAVTVTSVANIDFHARHRIQIWLKAAGKKMEMETTCAVDVTLLYWVGEWVSG